MTEPVVMLMDGHEVEVLGPDEDLHGYVIIKFLDGAEHEARVPYSWLEKP